MFIKDGKTLFGNSGLLFSILILVILLYLSYNKCYVNHNNHNNQYKQKEIENFYVITTPTPTTNTTLPSPDSVRIVIESGSITVNFTMNNITGVETPSKFTIVLAQYDNNKKNTGNNKFFLSNEYELTSTVAVNTNTYQTNVCSLVDGAPKCQYKFNNLDIRDANGNLFYYKIGISAVYSNYSSPFVMPYNVNTKDRLFTIDASTEKQNQQYNDFIKYQESLTKTSNQSLLNNYNSTMSTADGKYELIKSQLGNYPDSLLLDEQTINETSLGDLLDKTMAQGIINLNVKM